jgi:hypothetical protein
VKTILFSLFLVGASWGQALTPSTDTPGTPEENGIVTTLALQYQRIRNTVRDMYQSIQYGKAMIQTVEDQRRWLHRNIQGWKDVGKRVVRIVDDPKRWDKKLQDLEDIFDKTDVLLFQEPQKFDALMARQERYATGAGGAAAMALNVPLVRDFFEYNSSLYREGQAHIPDFEGADPETNAWLKERERQRLEDAKAILTEQQSGRVRDATVLVASQAQAQIGALKAMQRKRGIRYAENYDLLQGNKPNTKEMASAFNGLKTLDSELDLLVLTNLELQMMWAQLGTQIFDLSSIRESEIHTTESMEVFSNALSP